MAELVDELSDEQVKHIIDKHELFINRLLIKQIINSSQGKCDAIIKTIRKLVAEKQSNKTIPTNIIVHNQDREIESNGITTSTLIHNNTYNYFSTISDDSLNIILSFLQLEDFFDHINPWEENLVLINKRWNTCVTHQVIKRNNKQTDCARCSYKFLTIEQLHRLFILNKNARVFDFLSPNGKFDQVLIKRFAWPVCNVFKSEMHRNLFVSTDVVRDSRRLLPALTGGSKIKFQQLTGPCAHINRVFRLAASNYDSRLYFNDKMDTYTIDLGIDASRLITSGKLKTKFAIKNRLIKRPAFCMNQFKRIFDQMYHLGHKNMYKLLEINLQKLRDYDCRGDTMLRDKIFSIANVAKHTKRKWVIGWVKRDQLFVRNQLVIWIQVTPGTPHRFVSLQLYVHIDCLSNHCNHCDFISLDTFGKHTSPNDLRALLQHCHEFSSISLKSSPTINVDIIPVFMFDFDRTYTRCPMLRNLSICKPCADLKYVLVDYKHCEDIMAPALLINPKTKTYFSNRDINVLKQWIGKMIVRVFISKQRHQRGFYRMVNKYHNTSKMMKLFHDKQLSEVDYFFDVEIHIDDSKVKYFGEISSVDEQKHLLKLICSKFALQMSMTKKIKHQITNSMTRLF